MTRPTGLCSAHQVPGSDSTCETCWPPARDLDEAMDRLSALGDQLGAVLRHHREPERFSLNAFVHEGSATWCASIGRFQGRPPWAWHALPGLDYPEGYRLNSYIDGRRIATESVPGSLASEIKSRYHARPDLRPDVAGRIPEPRGQR